MKSSANEEPLKRDPLGEDSVGISAVRPYLTIRDLARLLQISESNLRSLVRRNEIPYFRLGPRTIRFIQADVEAWLRSKTSGKSRNDESASYLAGEDGPELVPKSQKKQSHPRINTASSPIAKAAAKRLAALR